MIRIDPESTQDWSLIISALRQRMPASDIAEYCERTHSWIYQLAQGGIRDPSFIPACKLLELYMRVVTEDRQNTNASHVDDGV